MSSWQPFLARRWPAVALVVSLILNGFLIGMLVTDSLKPRRGGFSGDRLTRFEIRRFDDRLPRAAVDQITSELKTLAPDLDKRIAAMREMRGEIMRMMAAPEPDRVAIDAKLAELRAAAASMQEEVQRATYDAVLKLPPEDRAHLAEAKGG